MFERNTASLVEGIKRARVLQMTNEDIYYKAREVAAGVLDTLASYTILMAQAATDYPPSALLDRLQALLQQFARIGLHGKEVFQVRETNSAEVVVACSALDAPSMCSSLIQAISLRERLAALIQHETDAPQQQIDMTQARSYLSNVLISR